LVISECLKENVPLGSTFDIVKLSKFQQCLAASGVPGTGPDPEAARRTLIEVESRLRMVSHALEGLMSSSDEAEAQEHLDAAVALLDAARAALEVA
jgi:hypothetical protein